MRPNDFPKSGQRLLVKEDQEDNLYQDYFDRPTDFSDDQFSRTPKSHSLKIFQKLPIFPQDMAAHRLRAAERIGKKSSSSEEESTIFSSSGRRMHQIKEGEIYIRLPKNMG